MKNEGYDNFDEDELSREQVLLLYGYKPAALLQWDELKVREKAESAN